jgi:large subunit ribosomal protein L6
MNPLASTSMLRTTASRLSGTATSRRCISSTSYRQSHIGSAPLTIPSTVTLELPAHTLPLSSTSANSPLRSIAITGPLGRHDLPIAHPVVLHPPTPENPNQLSVTVQNPDLKAQAALWGLTRALLGNAVVGVSEGYRVVLRLVGVGYRANVEEIPPTLRRLLLQPRSPTHTPLTSEEAPTDRLNLKLGYAHPIYVDIPRGITVSTPQPTRIVLQGTDKQKLGLFAAKIRRWRKPEPYRGKVGDPSSPLSLSYCFSVPCTQN